MLSSLHRSTSHSCRSKYVFAIVWNQIENNIQAIVLFHVVGYADKLCIPFTGKLATAHVRAKAIGLDTKNKCIELDNEKSLKYTDLVIATGTGSPFPGKLGFDNEGFSKETILQKYEVFRDEVIYALCGILKF